MFTKKILSTSIAMVVTFGAVQVHAADATKSDTVEEIVVSGIRASLTKALDVKKENLQIVDSVVAEDIGKFPDNNLVESLQRVTGVQVTNRASGEIAGISIRGLTDVTTTVNGRNIFTASGTAVAIQDIPTSLIKQVDVYKTRSADQIESGIAGVVDVKTSRPFDFSGSKFVIAARDVYQEQAGKTEPVISALASDRWDTSAGEFGALVNVSYNKTSYRDQSVTPGAMVPFETNDPVAGYTNYQRIFPTDAGATWQPGTLNGLPTAAGSTMLLNGVQSPYILSRDAIFASDFTGTRKRTGANISLQYAPNDTSEYTFETFYSGYRNQSSNSLLFSFVDWWGDYAADPSAANIVLYPGTNIVKSRTTGHPYQFTSGDSTIGQTDSYVYSFGGKWDLTDNLKVKSELVYQKSTFKSDFIAMRFEKGGYGINVDFNSGGGLPAYNFIDNPDTADINESNQADLSQWNSAQFYDNSVKNDGSANTFTTDAIYTTDLNLFKTVKFGVRYDDRKASESTNKLYDLNGNVIDSGYVNNIDLSMPGLATTNSGFFDGRSDVPTSWASANGNYLASHADAMRGLYGVVAGPLAETFNVDEKTTNLYVESDYETELAGRKLDGEFGVRYTHIATDMAFSPFTSEDVGSTSSSKFSPDLLVRYHLTDSLLTRFSYSETVRRPNFVDLNPYISYHPDVTNIGYGTASGGNPDLKPTESKNYDLSLEWYFGKSSSLYGTLFERDITGLIIGFNHPVQHAKTESDPTPYTFILGQPYNASNGKLHGAELGAVWFPENLPGMLDGFGIQASYTMLDSSQQTPITDDAGVITSVKTTKMFGVSDSSYSVVLAYDKDKLGARLSYSWRSAFLNNYEAATFANPLEVWRKPEASLDLQVSYKVLDNLEITLDGTNLTNEIYQSHYGENGATTNDFGSSLYSRTFALGARYSF